VERVTVDFLERLRNLTWESILAALQAHYGGVTWPFVRDLLTDYGVFLVMALGLYVLLSAGQVSLGHAGLVGIAAYASAVMVVKLGLPFWLALPLAGLVGIGAGLAYCALLGLRLTGFYLAIGTFALGEMLITIWLNSDYLGGAIGFVGIPLRSRWPVVLAVVLLVLFAVWRLERSRFNLAFRAVRDNEVVAGAMGVDVKRTKLLAWGIGGFITGVGGCLHAHRVTVLTPGEFGIYFSITLLLGPLLGGLRTFWGTVLGGAVVYFVPWLTTTDEPRDRLMLYGVVLVALMILRPQGLLGAGGSERGARRTPAARPADPPADRVSAMKEES
jgi:branched-chain amino acid transport system permease protein